jgi:hypothetical protein
MEKIATHFNADAGNISVSFAILAQVVDALVDGLKDAERKPDREIASLNAKIAKLEIALEARGGLKYVGTFKEGCVYDADHFVTHASSVWHCNRRTMTVPSNGAAAWQLAVRQGERGRDGRDGKEGKDAKHN